MPKLASPAIFLVTSAPGTSLTLMPPADRSGGLMILMMIRITERIPSPATMALTATGALSFALLGGTVVGCAFLVELGFLDGRRRLEGFDVHALVTYDGE